VAKIRRPIGTITVTNNKEGAFVTEIHVTDDDLFPLILEQAEGMALLAGWDSLTVHTNVMSRQTFLTASGYSSPEESVFWKRLRSEDRELSEGIDEAVVRLRVALEARLRLGDNEYAGAWKTKTVHELKRMLLEEDLDAFIYKAMIDLKGG
jgi:hypothetical protein